MVRAPCCEKMGLKKGPWSPDEDQILVTYIQKHGHGNWRALPKQAGLLRCGKSCRLRWTNYLRPDIKRGNFSKEEEDTIFALHQLLGNRWSAIAARLPGRTDNEIKNIWHTHLKKKLNSGNNNNPFPQIQMLPISHSKLISDSIRVSSPPPLQACSSSDLSSLTDDDKKPPPVKKEETDYTSEYFPQIDDTFWSEPATNHNIVRCSNVMKMEEDETAPFVDGDGEGDAAGTAGSLDFWYNLFIRAGDLPELPEF